MSKPTYEELEAQLHAVVAENVALKSCAEFYNAGLSPVKGTFGLEWKPTEKLLDDCGSVASDALKTPATDAILASLRAQSMADGVIALADKVESLPYFIGVKQQFIRNFAAQLRQSVQVKGVQS